MADGQAVCPSCGMAAIPGAVPAPQTQVPTPASPPQLSPDGQWMWNGTQWVPAAAPPPPPPPPAAAGYLMPGGGYPMGGAPYPGQVANSGTNGLSIASLVLGILWLWGVGSILAIVFGHVGKKQIREQGQGGNGLATAGLVLGYLGVAGAVFFILVVAGAVSTFNSEVSKNEAPQVRADMRNAATAEESFLTDNDVYTANVSDLTAEGYVKGFGTEIALSTDGNAGYCIVGSFQGEGDWYLYDSQNISLFSNSYGSLSEAEGLCSVGSSFSAPE